ncbi:MAG: hypothetical protein QM731_13145 [Chitinophagaceae bacterium]
MIESATIELRKKGELVFEVKARRSFQSAISLMYQKGENSSKKFITALSVYFVKGTNITTINDISPLLPGIYSVCIFHNPDPLKPSELVYKDYEAKPLQPLISKKLVIE